MAKKLRMKSWLYAGLSLCMLVAVASIFIAKKNQAPSVEAGRKTASVARVCERVFSGAASAPGLKVLMRPISGKSTFEKLWELDKRPLNQKQEGTLNGADFSRLDLRGFNFRGLELNRVNFEGTNLREARFERANLKEVFMKDADVHGANFAKASLTRVVAQGAKFRQANFTGAQIVRSSLKGAKFTEANMRDFTSFNSNMREADFSNANLTGVAFRQANLEGAKFDGAKIESDVIGGGITIESSNLKDVDLRTSKTNKRAAVFITRSTVNEGTHFPMGKRISGDNTYQGTKYSHLEGLLRARGQLFQGEKNNYKHSPEEKAIYNAVHRNKVQQRVNPEKVEAHLKSSKKRMIEEGRLIMDPKAAREDLRREEQSKLEERRFQIEAFRGDREQGKSFQQQIRQWKLWQRQQKNQ